MNTRAGGLQVAGGDKDILDSGAELSAFVRDVGQTLLDGQRHTTAGFGTFSTCTRKATACIHVAIFH